MARVVVTGGAGKLGRACVDELVGRGWDVVVLDRVPPPSESGAVFLPIDLTDYGQVLDAMLGVEERYDRLDALVHLAAVPAPGIVPDHHATFANNMNSHLERVQRGPAGRGEEHRVGIERDGARAAVRHPAALRPGRRGVPAAARVDVFAGQDPGRDNGRAVVPLGPGAEDDRAAVLQRDGPADYAAISVLRRRRELAEVEPLGLHRRPRRCAGGPPGARVGPDRDARSSSSPTPTP